MIETVAELVEVRPGRELFVRKFVLNETKPVQLQLFAMHGLCATERQFHAILPHIEQQLSDYAVECIMYDWMGCGQSPIIDRWDAYHNTETKEDLRAVIEKFVQKDKETVFIAHSYGPSILLPTLKDVKVKIKGIALISTTLRSKETSKDMVYDGGHPVMYLPLFILNVIQSFLSKSFCDMAIHPDHQQLKDIVMQDSDSNDMYMAKAYHRHTVWASMNNIVDQQYLPKEITVIHGVDDGLIPAHLGKILADKLKAAWIPIERASHLVLIEQPKQVADAIYQILSK